MKQKHLIILDIFDELKFNVGRITLINFLLGRINSTIKKYHLDELTDYGVLYKTSHNEINNLINVMIEKDLLVIESISSRNGHFKIIKRTTIGERELINPQLELSGKDYLNWRPQTEPKNFKEELNDFNIQNDNTKDRTDKINNNTNPNTTYNNYLKSRMRESSNKKAEKFSSLNRFEKNCLKFSEKEKLLVKSFDFFLKKFNLEQKKSIVSQSKRILCIAGAGTGKTTVLTKKIEFLTKFCGVKENKVLAITFTRKAAYEMKERLENNGILNIEVKTFNSFCEHILKKYNLNKRILTFYDKIKITDKILIKLNINKKQLLRDYFSEPNLIEDEYFIRFKTLIRDLFSIIDFYKSHQNGDKFLETNYSDLLTKFYERSKVPKERRVAELIYRILKEILDIEKREKIHDYNDQIISVIQFFIKNPNLVPKYQYILIDEFQDINEMQLNLIKLLKPSNIFAVGDPRQAIYGWRGSDVTLLYNFPEIFGKTEIISLKTNYRNNSQILDFANESIRCMHLSNLVPCEKNNDNRSNAINLIKFKREKEEIYFVIDKIKKIYNSTERIFLLARTNKILKKFAEELELRGINFEIKSENENSIEHLQSSFTNKNKESRLVLATIHAIKGMEAEHIFLVSTNCYSFPNCVEDNFVFSLIKEESNFYKRYNKDLEELRLFYVAVTRASKKLYITYTKILTPFIDNYMLELTNSKNRNDRIKHILEKYNRYNPQNKRILLNLLKDWRSKRAVELNIASTDIISNMVLKQISEKLPKNITELKKINSISSKQLMNYGNEILTILNKKL